VLVELAILLYEQDKLSLGHAAKLAGMKKTDFNHLLAVRGVPTHYDLQDWEQDLATLRSLVHR
jgi:predicted HTH domain antitoxin